MQNRQTQSYLKQISILEQSITQIECLVEIVQGVVKTHQEEVSRQEAFEVSHLQQL